MNIVTLLEDYENNHISFTEPIKNTVIDDSEFIRLYYSTDDIVLNGVYIYVCLINTTLEQYYNKYKCVFCKKSNVTTISKLEAIEKQILAKYSNRRNKLPEYSIHNQIMNGYIKICTNDPQKYKSGSNIELILKISGLWENETSYGVTFKFIPILED